MANREDNSSADKTDVGSIVGTWSPQWSMWEDMPTPTEDLRDVALTFADGQCEVRRGEKLIRRGTYSADPRQSPKTIDVCFTESDVSELISAPLHGIYEVDGEQLRICYGAPGGHRARSFSADKGTEQYLAEYRRCNGMG